jgi:hypothetical protein
VSRRFSHALQQFRGGLPIAKIDYYGLKLGTAEFSSGCLHVGTNLYRNSKPLQYVGKEVDCFQVISNQEEAHTYVMHRHAPSIAR